MRNIICVLLVVLNICNAYSQDSEPSGWSFIWDSDEIPKPFNTDSIEQKSMLTGFQWSSTLNMNNALLNNTFATQGYDSLEAGSSRTYPLLFINQPTWMDNKYYVIGAWFAPFMQYDPALFIDSPGDFYTRPGDPSDPVFGFMNIKGRILDESDSTDTNYSRLILEKDSLNLLDSIVLSEPWLNNVIKHTSIGDRLEDAEDSIYNGEAWYLSLNLRRYNSDTSSGADTVLSIRLPYFTSDTTIAEGYIVFDSIPGTGWFDLPGHQILANLPSK